jgi:hypothetical protein
MSDQKYIQELHVDHKMWLSELTLASDQVKSFQNRLEEVVKANNTVEVLAQVEHFQNQFIREKEIIDILNHDIHESEAKLTTQVASNTIAVDHRKVSDDEGLRDRMLGFQKIFAEMRTEFTSFLAKTL